MDSGHAGHYTCPNGHNQDPHSPMAVTNWGTEIHEQTRPEPGDAPIPWDEAWEIALKKLSNWKAPGPDGIPSYWLKAFPKIGEKLRERLKEVRDGVREMPAWLVTGRTVLIPKEGNDNCDPEKFRPITCLNTTYKLFTGTMAVVLKDHVDRKNVLPEEQKALQKGRRGCLDALVIDGAIAQEAKIFNRNLSIAWIDYRKAFDMIPHRWIIDMLAAIRAPTKIQNTIRTLIPLWQTSINLRTEEGTETIRIKLKRGLFQGDSLSPLLFCLCVSLLSYALNRGKGFSSAYQPRPTTHLMFMDDLKIFEESRAELIRAVAVAEGISKAVGMTLGLRKCAVAHAVGGRVVQGGNLPLATGGTISEVEYGETYKYLGVSQLFEANLGRTKQRIKSELYKRLRKTWQSDLNARNKTRANNSWAVAVLRYFFGMMKWSKRELLEMDRKARRIMRLNKSHHMNASLERLYLPRNEGGRGLQSIEMTWEREVVGSVRYLVECPDPQVKGAMKLQELRKNMGLYSYVETAQEVLRKYDIDVSLWSPLPTDSPGPKSLVAELKALQMEKLKASLEGKVIHSVFYKETTKDDCDQKATHKWLQEGRLQSETESLIIAAQDGVIHTTGYRNRILKHHVRPIL